MKTDVLFYSLLARLPEIFFELIGAPAARALQYRLDALEIKQTSYRMDGVFRPIASEPGLPIYFTEVQFQRNKRFYQRLFSRIFDYFDQTEDSRKWCVRVIFAERLMDPGLPTEFEGFFTEGVLERYYLEDLIGQEDLPVELEMIRLIVTPEAEAAEQAHRVLRRAREETEPGSRRREMVESAETVIVYKFPHLSREELEHMFDMIDLKDTRYYQDVFNDGKEEGQEEGERQGKLHAVPLLVESGVSAERIARELGLSIEAVREAATSHAGRNGSSAGQA